MDKKFVINGQEVSVQDFKKENGKVRFSYAGKSYSFETLEKRDGAVVIQGEKRFKAVASSPNRDGESIVMCLGREAVLSEAGKKLKKASHGAGGLSSPMPGKIFKILKDVGSSVSKGETILVLEAMKMEHAIRADKDGVVKKITFKTGELVQGGVILAEVE